MKTIFTHLKYFGIGVIGLLGLCVLILIVLGIYEGSKPYHENLKICIQAISLTALIYFLGKLIVTHKL